ncbi:MAG: glycosyltransferase family 39 protein [Gammaproteobacteria bacterium]
MNAVPSSGFRSLIAWLTREDVPRLYDLLWLLLLGVAVLAAGVGLRDPWPPDEPRFALAARDMVETHQWLFPRIGGDLYPDKPPVFMWLQATAYALTGSLRIAFLLPTALAAIGILLLVYDLGRRLWDRPTGVAAALVLLALVQFQVQAKSAQIDTTLAFFTTLSLYGLMRHLIQGPQWSWFWAGCAAAGVGVITKGVGFIPLLVLFPWGWAAWRGWNVARPAGAARWAAGGLAFIGAVALWLVPMLLVVASSGDPALAAYRDEILFRQTAERYADAWGHREPVWYFVVNVIPWAWLPVTLLLPWLLPRWSRALGNRDPRVLLLGGWVLLVVAFFTASTGKRGVYMLPAVPAVALLAAPWAAELARRRGVRWILFGLSVILLVALGLFAVSPPERISRALEAGGGEVPWHFILAVLVGGALITAACRLRHAAAGFLGISLLMWSLYGWVGYPAVTDARSGRPIVEALQAEAPAGTQLGLVAWREQFLLYLDRPVVHFGHRKPRDEALADGLAWLATGDHRLVLIDDTGDGCLDPAAAVHLGYAHRRHWYLAGPGALDAACGDGRKRPADLFRYDPPGRRE